LVWHNRRSTRFRLPPARRGSPHQDLGAGAIQRRRRHPWRRSLAWRRRILCWRP